ncbi:MAG: transglycosylase SLT domain-containing protein [Cryomorphaceae bacterium]|nr:transglycosylase SLT domain-containing protein [Cryomorphaceae bacterium]
MIKKWLPALGVLFIVISLISITAFIVEEEESELGALTFKERFNEKYGIFALSLPNTLDFAGEEVPFEDVEVLERFDKELLSNTYFQSQGLLYFKRANRYFPAIEKVLKINKIPDDFKYLALIESGLTNVVSPAGAAGFWQFMPATAKQYGLEVNDFVDERYHFEKSTLAATVYLNNAYQKFGSWALAAAAYNAGSGRIEKSLEAQKVENYFDLLLNNETSRYVFRILAVKEIMNNPKDYGFHFREKDLYSPIPTYQVVVTQTIPDLADFAKEHGISYKILKYHNPWLRNTKLPVLSGKSYAIEIPREGYHRVMSGIESQYPDIKEENHPSEENVLPDDIVSPTDNQKTE